MASDYIHSLEPEREFLLRKTDFGIERFCCDLLGIACLIGAARA